MNFDKGCRELYIFFQVGNHIERAARKNYAVLPCLCSGECTSLFEAVRRRNICAIRLRRFAQRLGGQGSGIVGSDGDECREQRCDNRQIPFIRFVCHQAANADNLAVRTHGHLWMERMAVNGHLPLHLPNLRLGFSGGPLDFYQGYLRK